MERRTFFKSVLTTAAAATLPIPISDLLTPSIAPLEPEALPQLKCEWKLIHTPIRVPELTPEKIERCAQDMREMVDEHIRQREEAMQRSLFTDQPDRTGARANRDWYNAHLTEGGS